MHHDAPRPCQPDAMKFTTAATVVLGGVGLVQALPPAQIFLHPAASSQSDVSITAPEVNAVLSHRLGIQQYETLPKGLAAGSKKGQILFGDVGGDLEDDKPDRMKLVMVVYGGGPQGAFALVCSQTRLADNARTAEVVPSALAKGAPLTLWSPPSPQSWDSLLSIYIGRVVHSLDVTIGSLFGVQDFVARHGANSLLDWASEWESRTEDWVKWAEEKLGIARTMMPQEQYSRWLTSAYVAEPVRYLSEFDVPREKTDALCRPRKR